jgi:hypothetical protein
MAQPPQAPGLGEGLLAPGVIRLFGREFTGLELGKNEEFGGDLGIIPTSNNPLALQEMISRLERARQEHPAEANAAAQARPGPGLKPLLARIYGFSYLGSYYKLANPPVLRVYGEGIEVNPGYNPENSMDVLGVEFKNQDFVDGIRMWPADQLDVTVRIDITIGSLREILLDSDMSQDANMNSNVPPSRADVVGRDSGLVGRDSGLVGRDSGLVGRDSGFVGRSRR